MKTPENKQCYSLKIPLSALRADLPIGEGFGLRNFTSLCLPLWGRCHAVTEGGCLKLMTLENKAFSVFHSQTMREPSFVTVIFSADAGKILTIA